MKFLFSVLLTLISTSAFAQQLPMHGPSADQLEMMAKHNAEMASQPQLGPVLGARADRKPFYEYDHTAYVVMSDDDFGGMATDMKATIAANLPAGVTLLVFTQSSDKSYQQDLISQYGASIGADRVKVLEIPAGGDGFWARDGLPIPVWEGTQLTLVDNIYYHGYEPDSYFGQLFAAPITKTGYYYEGGNFMVNAKGDCLVVNRKKVYPGGTADVTIIPDSVFTGTYGCKTLTRLKHLKGIGHADEVVKFVNDTTVLTDTADYKPQLEKLGLTVVMLPEPQLDYETYANSLIVNDTVFVPVFGESGDAAAIAAYQAAGYKTVSVQSRELATGGEGGLHCITMNYPTVTLHDITRAFNVISITEKSK